jgi:hypothetical protein
MSNKEDELDVKKSLNLDSILDDKTAKSIHLETQKDLEYQLQLFKESLEREFDQKRLELLENKDLRIKKMKDEIEQEIKTDLESEKRRLEREQDDKIK